MPYQRNGKWYADIRHTTADGRRARCRRALGSHVQSLRAAKRAENELSAELESERHRIAMGGSSGLPVVYLSGMLDHYLEQGGLKVPTVANYERDIRRHILPALGDIPISQIHRRDIDQMIVALRKTLAPATVSKILAPLSGALRLAVVWEWLETSPMVGISWPKTKAPEDGDFVWFDSTQTAAFLRTAEEVAADKWRMWFLGFRSGLRIGELIALEEGDLDLVLGSVHVQRTWTRFGVFPPKGNRSRRVSLSPPTVKTLRRTRHLNGDLFCPRRSGKMWDYDNALRSWRKVVRIAGLPACSPHTARHSYASQLVQRGVPLVAVQRLLGHKTLKETQRYAHLAPTDTARWVALLDEANGTQTGHSGVNRK